MKLFIKATANEDIVNYPIDSYPLHLGVTEAGTIKQGTINQAVGIGALPMVIRCLTRLGDPIMKLK